jgi:hypothetical protein
VTRLQVIQFEDAALAWWYQQRDELDMAPPYQRRGGLWNTRTRGLLIDSILNGYDIPKLYVADLSYVRFQEHVSLAVLPRKQNLRYAVIDGKQRFDAIFGFFENDLPLNSDFVYQDDPTVAVAGLRYGELRERFPLLARSFEQFRLTVMRVITDDEARISELFVRLNTSKPLTGAEVRNAMAGVVPILIRELADHDLFASRVRFDTQRGQDQNVAAKLLLIEFHGGFFVPTKKRELDRFVAEAADSPEAEVDYERARERVNGVLDVMAGIFHERDWLLRSQGPLSLYYWLVREYGGVHSHAIRPFLSDFDEALRQTRAALRQGINVEAIDPELAFYNDLNRSTNDVGSLEGRYTILARRFARWVEGDRSLAELAGQLQL